jgi:predicted amidohydrolase YtcJ
MFRRVPHFGPRPAPASGFPFAKIFTGDEENPYAEAVAIRGDQIVAVGSFPEVAKSVSQNAYLQDLYSQKVVAER